MRLLAGHNLPATGLILPGHGLRYDPLYSLFASGQPGTVLAIGDPRTACLVERTSPSTVAGPGDPVGTIMDLTTGLTYVAPTDAARAVLRREPIGGARQLLVHSDDLSQTAWVKTNTTVQADDGWWRVIAGAGIVEQTALRQSAEVAAGRFYCISFDYEQVGVPFFMVYLVRQFTSNDSPEGRRVVIDTQTGEVNYYFNGAASNAFARTISLGSGRWRVEVIAECYATVASVVSALLVFLKNTGTSGNGGTFGGGEYLRIRNVQVEDVTDQVVGGDPSTAVSTAWQRSGATLNDITEPGKRDDWKLRLDAVDDFYDSTTAVDFSGSDKMFVAFAGRKRNDAADGQIVSNVWAGTAGINGNWGLLHSSSLGDASRRTWTAWTRGTNLRAIKSIGPLAAPDLAVIDARLDNAAADAAAQITLARNGLVSTLATADGTSPGNFAADRAIRLFARSAGNLHAPVDVSALLVRGGPITDAERARVLRAFAFKIGVPLDV